MSGMTTANMDRLTRSELWSNQLKDVLEDELGAQKWVDWMTEFPDGNTFTIPGRPSCPLLGSGYWRVQFHDY